MGFFRCRECGAPNDQAAECRVCGGRTFVLGREARLLATTITLPERRGNLVPISEAPSLRRERQ